MEGRTKVWKEAGLAGALDPVPPGLSDMRSTVDPAVPGSLLESPHALFSSPLWEASALGFPSLQNRGSEPPRSQGTCVGRPPALTAHRDPRGWSLFPLPSYLPTPNPQTPGAGSQPSFLRFWGQASCSLSPQALPFMGTPEGPCFCSSRYPQTGSSLNRDPEAEPSPLCKDPEAQLLTGAPSKILFPCHCSQRS